MEILPLISEKAEKLKAKGIYVFKVPKEANKTEIKKEVERRFKVKVEKVRVVNVKPKPRRWGQIEGKKSGFKKALVKLKEGKIEF